MVDSLVEFYDILGQLEGLLGRRTLGECRRATSWDRRGVYFFFEPRELRSRSGPGLRVVRVGTHAVASTSRATLWDRLSAHRGSLSGGGNHRGSVFRKLVGQSLIRRDHLEAPTWGVGSTSSCGDRVQEAPVERAVSAFLGRTSLLWLPVDDAPGPQSARAVVERNAIALLSNRLRPLDPASPGWLGRWCPHRLVQESGLWNCDHVERPFEPGFLKQMRALLPTAYGAAAENASLAADRPRSEELMARLRRTTKAGDVVKTVTRGRKNTIVSDDGETLMVATGSGRGPQAVPWEWIRGAVEEYCRRGSLTQDQIPGRGRFRSAFIFALLADKLDEFREGLEPA